MVWPNMTMTLLARWRRMTSVRLALAVATALAPAACEGTTARLSSEQEKRFNAEGVLRRGPNIDFRFTRDPSGRSERWENRRASILVTGSSILIYKNEKTGLEITPRTQREVSVERSGSRIRIRAGRGKSEEVWSFEESEDPVGWTADIRTVIKHSKGAATR